MTTPTNQYPTAGHAQSSLVLWEAGGGRVGRAAEREENPTHEPVSVTWSAGEIDAAQLSLGVGEGAGASFGRRCKIGLLLHCAVKYGLTVI